MLPIQIGEKFVEFQLAYRELSYEGEKPQTDAEAFSISMAKWLVLYQVAFLKKEVHDGGLETCGFCLLYNHEGCKGCPIFAQTGKSICNGTPFVDAAGALKSYMEPAYRVRMVRAEIDFLLDLGVRHGWLDLEGKKDILEWVELQKGE